MANYFFTSDTHFFHGNIMKYCHRPFYSIDEMNETIIENWNSVVRKDDFIYHLGDFAMGPLQKAQEIFERLNGKKYLIRGNHDNSSIRQLGWVWVKDTAMITVKEQKIWLSHYPHRTWNRARHGAWHLFGHIHNNLAPYWLSFNVGVDAWDFHPVSFDEVEDIMQRLKKLQKDLEGADYHESEVLISELLDDTMLEVDYY